MFRYRRTVAVVVLVTTGACYNSRPLESFPPALGNDLVAMLTDSGASEMASVVGPRVRGLTGRYLGLQSDTLLLSVRTVIMRDGNEVFWRGEQVGLPRANVASLSRREFSRAKSSLIVGAVIAALVGITGVVYSGHAGSTPPPPPPPQ
jgi:hypothetical protein